jgi:hypothetical protein
VHQPITVLSPSREWTHSAYSSFRTKLEQRAGLAAAYSCRFQNPATQRVPRSRGAESRNQGATVSEAANMVEDGSLLLPLLLADHNTVEQPATCARMCALYVGSRCPCILRLRLHQSCTDVAMYMSEHMCIPYTLNDGHTYP